MVYQPYIPPQSNNSNYNNMSPKQKKSWRTAVISVIALVMVALLLIYTGGVDAIMRLLGVGAASVYEVSLTSTYDWLGTGSNPAIIGGAGALDGTNVFAQFSSVPNDPHPDAKNLGLITSIFSSANPIDEIYQQHIYISPVVDLGQIAPYLNDIEVIDYSPEGAGINYFYRSATTQTALAGSVFVPVDLTLANDLDNQVKVRTAIIGQTINQYAQIKIELVNNAFSQRSAVYAVNLQYKPVAPVNNSVSQSNIATTRTITIGYEATSAPESADIDILSSDVNNALVYSIQGVNLAQTALAGYVFQANLAPGAYALAISAPQLQTRIIPFAVGNDSNIIINAGSSAISAGWPVNDLNGDGVINSIDFLILQQQNQ